MYVCIMYVCTPYVEAANRRPPRPHGDTICLQCFDSFRPVDQHCPPPAGSAWLLPPRSDPWVAKTDSNQTSMRLMAKQKCEMQCIGSAAYLLPVRRRCWLGPLIAAGLTCHFLLRASLSGLSRTASQFSVERLVTSPSSLAPPPLHHLHATGVATWLPVSLACYTYTHVASREGAVDVSPIRAATGRGRGVRRGRAPDA